MLALGVAVVTYNQAGYLRRFLDRYFFLKKKAQDLPPLFVVNDGSTDRTESLLREYSGTLFYYNTRHQGISKCRNLALKSFPCEWLAFTDTDCLLTEDYPQALLSIPAKYPDAVAVEGVVRGHSANEPRANGPWQFAHTMDNRKGGMCATANMVFHVDRTLALGGFDEYFGNYREDVDLGLRIRHRAPAPDPILASIPASVPAPVPFEESLVVEHPVVPRRLWPSLRSAPRRLGNVVSSEIRLQQKHPQSYSSVRAKSSARETLGTLSLKHAYLECRPFFKSGRRRTGKEWMAFCETLVCALWEQLWYALHTMHQSRRLGKPATGPKSKAWEP